MRGLLFLKTASKVTPLNMYGVSSTILTPKSSSFFLITLLMLGHFPLSGYASLIPAYALTHTTLTLNLLMLQ